MVSHQARPILSVPYAHDLNDSLELVSRRTPSQLYYECLIDQFEEMLRNRAPSAGDADRDAQLRAWPAYRLRQFRRVIEHIQKHHDRVWITHRARSAIHRVATCGYRARQLRAQCFLSGRSPSNLLIPTEEEKSCVNRTGRVSIVSGNCACAGLCVDDTLAQSYPSSRFTSWWDFRGSGSDFVARLAAKKLSNNWARP